MAKIDSLKRPFTWNLLLVLALSVTLVACTSQQVNSAPTATPQPVETVQVNLLIATEDGEDRWYRDFEVPQGTDVYQLTQMVTGGNMEATYYSEYRSHFVESIAGVAGQGSNYWIIWLWSDFNDKWEVLPVGADFFSLKDGHTLAWYYGDTSNGENPPKAIP
jgi:hypothetical protein